MEDQFKVESVKSPLGPHLRCGWDGTKQQRELTHGHFSSSQTRSGRGASDSRAPIDHRPGKEGPPLPATLPFVLRRRSRCQAKALRPRRRHLRRPRRVRLGLGRRPRRSTRRQALPLLLSQALEPQGQGKGQSQGGRALSSPHRAAHGQAPDQRRPSFGYQLGRDGSDDRNPIPVRPSDRDVCRAGEGRRGRPPPHPRRVLALRPGRDRALGQSGTRSRPTCRV